MKKTLIPLLAIALVVAVLATAVFYGLIADRLEPPRTAKASTSQIVAAARPIERGRALDPQDLKLVESACPLGTGKCLADPARLVGRLTAQAIVEGQLLSESMLAKAETGETPSAAIPKGWRAVTLHVAESSGVMTLLRAGDHVDIQSITPREPGSSVLEIRNLLRDVEVLQIGPPETAHSLMVGRPVITVLVPPADADRLSLADASGRVRITLRNRSETSENQGATPAVPQSAPSAALPPIRPVANPAPASQRVQFLVRMASGDSKALSQLSGFEDWNTLQVKALPPAVNLDQVLASLSEAKSVSVFESSRIEAPNLGSASVALDSLWHSVKEKGKGDAGLAIRFAPTIAPNAVRLKITPEITAQFEGQNAATRRIETELNLNDGQSLLISGLTDREHRDAVLGRWLPEMVRARHELVVFVTARLAR